MSIPEVVTTRLVLRPFDDGDNIPMHRILTGDGVLDYFPVTRPPSLEQVARFIDQQDKHWRERGYGLWAVERRSDRAFMGRCGLQYLPDTDETEVDFILGSGFWGHGYATEAGKAALAFGFDTLPVDEIVGIVHRQNTASQRVLEKLDMAGRRPCSYFGLDVFRYAISRTDFGRD